MNEPTSAASQRQTVIVELPPLENGDHLSRQEFERRYQATPHIKKAELIEGVVYMPSPVHLQSHAEPHARILTWLGVYCASTPQVQLGDNATVRLDLDNEPQPNALLRLQLAAGGRSSVSEDDYVEGAPELIVEVASSSASYDLHDKLQVYRRNGVQEYVVWRVDDKQIDWYRLVDGEYVPQKTDDAGLMHSQVFPGLRLAVQALLNGDLAQVLSELQERLGTPEHAAFVERLQKK
jgi:Uma2 family endonuclease